MYRWLVVAALAACSFQSGRAAPRDAFEGRDAPRDGTVTIVDAAGSGSGSGSGSLTCDPTACTAAGGACTAGTCVINGAPGGPIACPPASSCSVSCPSNNHACRDGLTCGELASCAFHCDADHVCDNGSTLTCAAGSTCETYCAGNHACDGLTIDCVAGATCIYHCCGGDSCTGGFSCAGAGCTNGGASCP